MGEVLGRNEPTPVYAKQAPPAEPWTRVSNCTAQRATRAGLLEPEVLPPSRKVGTPTEQLILSENETAVLHRPSSPSEEARGEVQHGASCRRSIRQLGLTEGHYGG